MKMIESMITGKPKYEEVRIINHHSFNINYYNMHFMQISMFETFHEEKLKLNFLYEVCYYLL